MVVRVTRLSTVSQINFGEGTRRNLVRGVTRSSGEPEEFDFPRGGTVRRLAVTRTDEGLSCPISNAQQQASYG